MGGSGREDARIQRTYTLLLQALTDAIGELMDILEVFTPTHSQGFYMQAIHRVFKYFLKNRQMYTLLFLDPRNVEARMLFRRTFIRASDERLEQSFPAVPQNDLTMYSRHFIGGLLTVVDWWLENDCETPSERIAEQFVRLVPNYYSVFSDFGNEFDM